MEEQKTHTTIPDFTLTLRLQRPHRSLEVLPDIELPSLTVLTGVNGAGKTHLLQAIKAGAVAVDGVDPSEILYFDWTTMYKLRSNRVERNDVRTSRQKLRDAVAAVRRSMDRELQRLICIHEIAPEVGCDAWTTLRRDKTIRQRSEIEKFLSDADDKIIARVGIEAFSILLSSDLNKVINESSLVLLDDREFELLPVTHSLGTQGFGAEEIGKIIMSYFDLYTHNRLCELDVAEGRKPDLPALSRAEFEALYGAPPWEVLTEVMQDLGLDFEIRGPSSYSIPEYTPRAIKQSTGTPIDLEDLSSGEKMLMALALSTYATKARRTDKAATVKLVLLDEIDAPLHPSMSRVMMKIIRSTIQERLGCAVILATHSPATVVVAPEGSLYVMRPGEPGIHWQSRERALRMLTANLPTLSLDFSGRRQVFVESSHDAQRYESLYRLYEAHLNSELSLSFIGVGVESNDGSRGAGCQVVREMVNKLRTHGNQTVWGLVDWDGEAASTDFIKVLAAGRRYAIENLLLDPLLVAALVIDADDVADFSRLALERNYSISALLAPNAGEERQQVIRSVQQLLLGPPSDESETTEVVYFGGFAQEVSADYLQLRGHDLGKRVFEVLPSLKRHRTERQLLERSIKLVKEHPGLLPRELLDVLSELLQP